MNAAPLNGPLPRARWTLVLALALALALAAGCAPTTGRWPGSPAAGPGLQAPRPAAVPAALQGPPPVAAADASAIDAEVARILAGSHSTMPPLQPVQPVAAASVAVIRADNQTPYVLVLRYSGPTSQRLSLKPQESAQLRLAPGTYSVAATAESAQGVRPFAGVQQIQGGSYASSWIIRTVVR
jgi:hypothetical protein